MSLYVVIAKRPGAKPTEPLPKFVAKTLAKQMHKLTGQEYKVIPADQTPKEEDETEA